MIISINSITVGDVVCEEAKISVAISEYGVAIRAVPMFGGVEYPEATISIVEQAGNLGDFENDVREHISALIKARQVTSLTVLPGLAG